MVTERRRSARHLFFADAEISDAQAYRVRSHTNELSRGGCYMDIVSPLASGSAVRVRLTHAGETLELPARVVHSTPNIGMGLAFEPVEGAEQVLGRWLDPGA
jgi:hypothetical protein